MRQYVIQPTEEKNETGWQQIQEQLGERDIIIGNNNMNGSDQTMRRLM